MLVKYFYLHLFLVAALVWSPCYGDWKSDANDRIELIRKRNAEIKVIDSDGNPVSDVNVLIEQIGHRFAFGTCITNTKMTDLYYKNFILNHFEWAVCENETKWKSNESTRDSETYAEADNIYQWSNSNGIKFRGHCLFWEQDNYFLPDWVRTLPCAEMPAEVNERIDSAVNHYKNKFLHWDVDNEMLTDDFFGTCLGEAGRVNMFQRAKLTDPGCLMFMNEYSGNSFGDYNSGPYVARANSLISMGAPIDALGIQGHLGANLTFDPELYYDDVLEPLAALNLPIWATEFDARHTDANVSADNIENYFRICFSHPSVEGIIMWGFLQGSMWRDDAYLIDTNYNLTVRGQRYEALIDEWTTPNDSNTTDASGKVSFRGFHGTYKITLSKTGQPTEIYTIELEPGETTAYFVLKRYISDVGILGSWVVGTTHTKETGTDRALVFIAHAEDNDNPSITLNSVSYGGQSMTKVVESVIGTTDNSRAYVVAYILNEAGVAAASGNTFGVLWNQRPDSVGYSSVFLQNVNQSDLIGATAGDKITNAALLTTPRLATNPGDMVIGAATCSSAGDYTMNNAFTEALELSITGTSAVDGYKTANGADEIPSVTHSTSTDNRQSAIGFVVKAPPVFLDCDDVQDAGYGLTSDISGDCYVNYIDLEIITGYWLNLDCTEPDNCGGADFEPTDGNVDFFDFARFAEQWLLCNDPEDPDCEHNW